MAAKKTVKTKKTNTKKSKINNIKFAWLKKHWIIITVLVAFSSVGVYVLGTSNAATQFYVSSLGYQCSTLPTLRSGSRGDCVKALQTGLNNRNTGLNQQFGTPFTKLAVDGAYGAKTVEAVKQFQTAHNSAGKKMAVDGVVGPATWDTFLNDCWVFSDPAMVGKYSKGVILLPGYACGNTSTGGK